MRVLITTFNLMKFRISFPKI